MIFTLDALPRALPNMGISPSKIETMSYGDCLCHNR
jgi:hypothetical protein